MSDMQRSSARDTALEVLMQVSRANAWSDGSLKRTIAKNKLDSREAALLSLIHILNMKAEVEKIREQIQNIE